MNSKKDRIWLCFGVLVSLLIAVSMLVLGHKQALFLFEGKTWYSDSWSYIPKILGIEEGASTPYPIMFILGRIFTGFLGAEWGLAVVLALLQFLSYWGVYYYFHKYLSASRTLTVPESFALSVTVCGLFFYSMIYSDEFVKWGIPNHYLGVYSPNPFHNATYIAARPFTILAFFAFAELLDEYEEKLNVPKMVWFSVVLLLATMTKPSFTLIFVTLACLVMLGKLVMARFSNFKNTFFLGCAFIPTLLDLLYQYSDVFTGTDLEGEAAGIGIEYMKVWGLESYNHWLAVLLVLLFPLVVLIFHCRDLLKNALYRLGWGLYAIGLLTFVFLYEKGYRVDHANFAWGYMAGLFFVVMVSVLVMLQDSVGKKGKLWQRALMWLAFAVHVCYGVAYFKWILDGNYYV
ncbi:MAG: hypothetical protein LUG61_10715 [Lachnospiraceae bacterium]|nr:hypothetical protein [Lachnospiraceae bacterium]